MKWKILALTLKKFSYFTTPALKCFLKKILIFFPKNICSEKVPYIFSEKTFLIFQETKLSYIFFKTFLLYFAKWTW